MQIKETLNFIKHLNFSQTSNSYIIKLDDGNYGCSDKIKKNLKTKQIAALAKECLDSIVAVEDFPLELRCKVLKMLINVLQIQSKRIIKSKPWWAQIAAFFGFKSLEEKTLDQNILLAKEQQNKYLNCHISKEHLLRDSPKRQLRDFYHKILDSANIDKIMDGSHAAYVSTIVLKDLMDYRNHLTEDEKLKYNELLMQVHDELSSGFNKSIFYSTNSAYDPGQRKKQESLFFDDLKKLKNNNPNLDKTVILLCGSKKHAVVFQFKMEQDGSYSLTIINTGSGATQSKRHPPNETHKMFSDIKYTGIQIEDLKSGFLERLLFLNNVKERKMKDVYALFKKEFEGKPHIKKGKGRTHKNQLKGTCAAKSISSWLNERLPAKVYRDYKAFMTKKKIDSLQQYANTVSKQELSELGKKFHMSANAMKNYISKMLVEGEKVLQKRLKKIPA